jgi:uncharacterized membrane protein YcfT
MKENIDEISFNNFKTIQKRINAKWKQPIQINFFLVLAIFKNEIISRTLDEIFVVSNLIQKIKYPYWNYCLNKKSNMKSQGVIKMLLFVETLLWGEAYYLR